MRQVLLNSRYYKLAPRTTVTHRAINPWNPAISSGAQEFSDFSQASLEEWHDFRGGIGLESALPDEKSRSTWSEGWDVTVSRSAVLQGKVKTAGSSALGSNFGVAPVKIIDFQNYTYAIGNSKIAKWNASNNAWDSVDTSLASPIDAVVIKDGTDEYLVVSSASAGIYTADGTSWSTLTGCQGYLCPFQGKLYAIDTDGGTVRASPKDNVDGSWTTFGLSGDLGTVHGLFSGKLLADQTPVLYFHGTKGLFSIDITNSYAYPQEINYPPMTNAGKTAMYWNAAIWLSTGGGIVHVSGNEARPVGPDIDDGLPSGYTGDVYDMIGVGNWVVYCVNGGTANKSSILKHHSTSGGNLQIYTSAAGSQITCLCHSPSSLYTNGRLWWGEGTDVKYAMFSDKTSNPKQIADYEYIVTSDKLIIPRFRKLAAIKKLALGVSAITKSCDANNYITVYYRINDTADWTSLGTLVSSPYPTTLSFNSGLGTAFYTIQFAAMMQRQTQGDFPYTFPINFDEYYHTSSPELESLLFYYLPRVVNISAWTFRIEATDANAEEIIAAIETARDTTTLVVFNPTGDPLKTSFNYNVAISSMPLEFYVENQQTRQGWVEVTCEQIYNG